MSAPRPFTVAVTGHRPNRMAIGEARAARRLALVLEALRAGSRGRERVAVSALAEGSDRLFATAALDLGYSLHVLLPFTSADYETTFSDKAATPVYRALLARAAKVTELPGSLANTKAAYEAVGRATADGADVLVAVWDGKPAAGRGGTPEIMEYALGAGKPLVWIDVARDRLPRLLEWRRDRGTMPTLDKLARRADALDERCLRALARRLTP